MAGAKVRGITIELSADASGVSKALQTVNKNISSTSKELKDIDKLLKLDPTNVTLLAQKHEALQRQIGNTKEKLDLLKKAEEDLQKEMKDGGTEEQQKQLAALQREIISTERDLDKYTDQLDETGKETDQLTESEKKAEDATGKLSGGFSVLKGALANLVADGLRKAVDGFKEVMTAAPKFADDILELADKTHLATDTLQELSYMSGLVDVDLSTIAGSMTKLTKSMAAAKVGTGTAADAFRTLGVSVVDTNGHLRDSEDVFFEAIDALGGIENEAERDAIAMNLFGKSATQLNPMIEAGSDALKGFADEAHKMGYVLDQDALEALGRVQDEFDRFQRQMDSVKNQIGAAVAPAIERGMKRIQQVVNNIDWNKIGKQIGKAFDGLITAFEWILSHGNVIKSMLTGIVTAMAVAKVVQFGQAVAALVPALNAATVAQEANNAAAMANPYVILAAAVIGLVTAMAAYGHSLDEAAKAQDVSWQETQKLIDQADEHIMAIDRCVESYNSMAEAREASVTAGMAELTHTQSLAEELQTLADANGNVSEENKARAEFILGELNTALGTEYTMTGNVIDRYNELVGSIDAVIEKKKAEIYLAAEEEAYRQAILNRDDAERTLIDTENEMLDVHAQIQANEAEIARLYGENGEGAAQNAKQIANLKLQNDELAGKLGELNTAYNDQKGVVAKYAYDVEQYESNMVKALEGNYDQIQYKSYETAKAEEKAAKEGATGIVNATKDGVKNWKKEMEDTAAQIPAGVASGINNNLSQVITAAANMAIKATEAFNNNMEISSPSKVMMKSAKYMVEGVAKGIAMNEGIAIGTMEQFSNDLVNAMNQTTSFGSMISGGRASSGSTFGSGDLSTVNNDVVINVYGSEGQNVNDLADVVIDKLQRTIQGSEAVYA